MSNTVVSLICKELCKKKKNLQSDLEYLIGGLKYGQMDISPNVPVYMC